MLRSERRPGPLGPGSDDRMSPSRLKLLDIALKMAVLLEFRWARRPGLSLRWIVVPRSALGAIDVRTRRALSRARRRRRGGAARRRRARGRSPCGRACRARGRARAASSGGSGTRRRSSASAASSSSSRVPLAERRGDVLGRDAERAQPALDPLGAPGVEPRGGPRRSAARSAASSTKPPSTQLRDDDLSASSRRDALARRGCRRSSSSVRSRRSSARQASAARVLEPRLPGPCRRSPAGDGVATGAVPAAARPPARVTPRPPSAAAASTAPGSRSIGVTRSWPMPSAA